MDEGTDGSVIRWFAQTERMGNDRITKRVYVAECKGSRIVDRPRKRWIDSINEYMKIKRGLDVKENDV